MNKTFPKVFSAITILVLVFAAMPLRSAKAVSTTIVISQVYGGGGNSGATYTNDFIELFNRGNTTVNVTGWSVQYASATGTSWAVTNLSGSIAPGQYYLVQEAAGTGGTTPLPTPDASGGIAMSATVGKVALVSSTTALSGACPLASTIDFVGFGSTANCFEGAAPTSTLSNTTDALRLNNGCTDTDNNATDFVTGPPNPRNTASPLNPCVSALEPKINEFSASTVGNDVEYVEIIGTANTDYSAYTILEIEGDAAVGSPAGTVDEVLNLGTTNASGLYLFNLPVNALENGTISLLLVKNFTGALGNDLDTNDDGTFDSTPWSALTDSVAVNDGGASDRTYGSPTLNVSYDGQPFAPGGASRIPDGFDTNLVTDWVRNDFDLAGIPPNIGTPVFGEAYNTPGAANAIVLPKLVINEIDYDQPSTDTAEFVEIRNNESVAVPLNGAALELVNGASGLAVVYDTITLPNVSLAAGDYFVVCANAATVSNCDVDDAPDTNFIQNGSPDAVGLRFNGVLIDAVSYTGDTLAPYTEGSGAGLADSAVTGQSISRCPDGSDTNVNNVDFTLTGITPGVSNDCAGVTPQLTITDVSLNEGNSGTTAFTFTVSLNRAALTGGVTFNIATADGTAQDDVPPTEDNDYVAKTLTGQSIPAGGTTYTFSVSVNGDTTPESDETFSVNVTNVTGATVIDSVGSGTIVNDDGLAITFIHDIQGSGSAVTGPGPFAVEAIVVGDYQTQGSGQLRGFFIQEEDADLDNPLAATSDGIFVFCNSCLTAVSVGDKVRVTGGALEFNGLSELSATTAASVTVLSSGNPLPTPASITLPVPGVPTGDLVAATAFINAYYEKFEGMLVTYPTLYVSEYFELARFGQLILSVNARPRQFTDVSLPSAAGYVNHQIDLASRTVILDDTDNLQNGNTNIPNTPYYYPQPGLSNTNFFRGGDTIANLTGVLHWSFNGLSGEDAWRVRPVTQAYNYTFTSVNSRPAVPNVGGDVKVASFNVLNYFLTVDVTASDNVGNCGASATLDCRGPDSVAERDRQQAKLTQALKGLDADVFGMIELENTPSVDPLGEIVADLNAATAPGTFAAINTGVVGTDAIKVGIIYKPGSVAPIGAPMIDNDSVFSRPPVAQLFETPDGGRFTVVINHFKSKGCDGSSGLNTDQGDGQGCFNAQRVSQAQALVDFVNAIIIATGDPDVLIIGDLNSYAKENPITTLEGAGYTNLVASLGDAGAYSYVFDGQLGYLDHALSTPSLTPQVTDVADWHINADEIPVFDYNDDVKDTGEAAFEEESDALPLDPAQPNAFRTSDHDPVVIGLNVNAPPTVDAGGPYSVDEGSSILLTASGDDPNGDTLTYAWDLDNNGSFETPGQSVSFSAALLDGPSGPFTVKVRATDPLGLYADATTTVSVDNVAPTVDAFFGSNSVSCGSNNATLTVNFTDPGVADTHSALIDWGDGNTQTVASLSSGATFSHTYASAGLYTATVTVTDDDGDSGTDTADVMVQFNTSGFLQPINADGTSVFKFGSTIPVKIRFTDCDGSTPADLAPTIKLTMLTGATPGLEINEPISTSAADTTGVMRFSTNQYIYNLATNPLPDSSATYLITVTIPLNGQTFTVQFSLKP